MTWYIDQTPRFRSEKARIAALAESAAWLRLKDWRLDTDVHLILDADIAVGEDVFSVSLRYPNHFPHSPPLVLPRGTTERWSNHQYGAGGELCLEWGPDNWHPDLTGADMLESAHRLLDVERATPGERVHAPSRHATSLGQDLRFKIMRFVVTRSAVQHLKTFVEGEQQRGMVVCNFQGISATYVLASLTAADGTEWINSDVPKAFVADGWERVAIATHWPRNQALPATKSANDFYAALTSNGITLLQDPRPDYFLLIQGEDFHAYSHTEGADNVHKLAVILPPPAANRVDDEHAVLATRRVGIVGCGSLGSKFAMMLARSGVENFLLVDDDVMFPDNLVRHALDWREVGMHKAAALARAINLVNAKATCKTRLDRLGGQEASGSLESLIEMLSKCDLIVDATADARVFNLLSATVEIGKKPLVWAEVFGGGIGGLIARYRPGIEPEPPIMRAIIEAWCVNKGKPIERAEIDYVTRTAGPPLVADDADVSAIAAHAARLAIDILIGREPSIFPYSVYMIGLANDWNFDQPFETHPIDVGHAQPKETVADDPEAQAEETAHIVAMLTKLANASVTPTSDS